MAKTITVTSVSVDYAGAGTVRINGTYADVTHAGPSQQVTVGEVPATKTSFIRLHRLTDAAVFCLRYGAATVAAYLTSWAKVAYALEPTLSHAPVVTDDPDADSTAFAKATLTLSGNAVAAETVTLGKDAGEKAYTWRASVSTTANEVKVGANAAESLDNLKAAVNGSAGSGTLYGSDTVAHTQVDATTNTDATQLFVSKTVGTAANSYKSEETMTNGAFGGTTFSGGLAAADFTATVSSELLSVNLWKESSDGTTYGNAIETAGIYDAGTQATGTLSASGTPSDGEIATVQGLTYTFKTALTTSPSTVAYEVLIGGSRANAMTNLRKAINDDGTSGTDYGTGTEAHPLVKASSGSTSVTITCRGGGTAGNSITTTCYGSSLSFGAATLGSGAASAAGDGALRVTPTATTQNGYYYKCTAVNMAGETDSEAAVLTVT